MKLSKSTLVLIVVTLATGTAHAGCVRMGFSTIANSCDKCVLAKIRHTSGGQEWHEEIRLQAFQDVPFRAKAQLTQVIGERECRRKAAAAGVSGTKAQAQPAGR